MTKSCTKQMVRICSIFGIFQFFVLSSLAADNYGAISARTPLLTFDISDAGSDTSNSTGSSLHYSPKLPTILGVETRIHGVTLGYSKALSVNTDKEEMNLTDYSLRLYYESFGFDALYSEFLGFRLTSANVLDLNTIPQDEIFRKDFAIKETNVNLYYFPIRLSFNLDRSFDPSQNDQVNGLGAGLVATYNNVGIDTQFGAIPTGFQSSFGPDGSMLRGSFESVSLSAALAGTLALKPLFLSAMASIGQGPQTIKYQNSSENRTTSGTATRQSLLALLGVSSSRFFLALQISYEAPKYTLKTLAISGTHTDAALKLGLKF